jgi:hypothetical protein
MDQLIKLVQDYWYKRVTLYVVVVASFLGSLYLFSIIDINKVSIPGIIISICVILIVSGVWYLTTGVPKVKRGRIGIAVAISAETEDELILPTNGGHLNEGSIHCFKV